MGKTTKYPSTLSSSISVNGNPLVATKTENGSTTASYNISDTQQKINDYIENSLLSSIPQINTFLPETIDNLSQEVNAYTQKGVKTINELYEPIIKNLENDIASRFGNLDNSIFMNNLSGIESQRANSVSDFVQDVQAKQSDLINNELEKQYNYLDFLTNYQNQNYQNMLSALGLGQDYLSSATKSTPQTNNIFSGVSLGNLNSLYKMASALSTAL